MGSGTSAALALYRGGTSLATPLARLFLETRARRGKEDRLRIGERLGRTRIVRPAGALLWVHGASIGEGLAVLPLIERLQARGFVVLLTTGTTSSAQVLAGHARAGLIHQFAPLDLAKALRAFLDHWRPLALILAESELWPNTMRECAVRKVPVALVNARLSERSQARWQRAPRMAREIFGTLAVCAAQSQEHARRFTHLGAPNVIVAGNLKYDGTPPSADPIELARLRAAIGSRPVVVAASTHLGEEHMLMRTHALLAAAHPDLLTILVPRDVSRAHEIADTAAAVRLRTAVRSRRDTISNTVQVMIADTFGEMGIWLRLASVAVIGKTFGEGGGQTPIEAVRCGAAVLHGPSVHQFAEIFDALDRDGGALEATEDSFAGLVDMLLADPARRRAITRAATQTLERLSGATARTLAALDAVLAHAQVATAS